MGGHISMMFEMGYSALPAIQGKKIHPIAVTSARRLDVLPDVPTMAESGLAGFESYNWQGIVAPAGTPAPIIARLNAEFNRILKEPDVQKAIADTGSQAGGGTPKTSPPSSRAKPGSGPTSSKLETSSSSNPRPRSAP